MSALTEFFGGHPWWVHLLALLPLASVLFLALLWIVEVLEHCGIKKPLRGPAYPGQALALLGTSMIAFIVYAFIVFMISKACQR